MASKHIHKADLIYYCVNEAHKFSDFGRNSLELQRYNVNGKNFVTMKKALSGWLSPRGVFFPCEWAHHERLREYLTRLFEVGGKGSDIEKLKAFEASWIKFQDKNNSGYDDLRPHMPCIETLTARQKLFLSDWYRTHYAKALQERGVIVISWKFVIDSDFNIKLKKEGEDEELPRTVRRIIRG